MLAKEMLDRNLPNYRMPYQELSNFVHSYLKELRFDFVAEEVVQHFLSKDILVKEIEDSETYIRFRFTCFFQYFLMRQMEYNPSFLKYVLDEENYLFFINEIDYYTGIKRDCSEILITIVDRMMAEYSQPLAIINDSENSFDDFFIEQDSIIKSMPDNFLKTLPERKPDEKAIDNITDEFLESIKPEKDIKKINRKISPINKLERHWALSARVLKNTEETRTPGLKDNSFEKIVKCSLIFASFYKFYINKYIEDNKGKVPIPENLLLSMDFVPLINEISLFTLLGSKKLSAVIRDKIKSDFKDKKVSDLERFTSVFLYSDMRGDGYEKFINQFVKQLRHLYICDMALFKIVSYYFFRSKDRSTDKIFLNIIADLFIKAKGQKQVIKGKVFEKNTDKSKIIQNYIEKKKDAEKEEKSFNGIPE